MNRNLLNTIPKGFKQTELGTIPDDWEISELRYIADIKTGPFGSTLHERDYVPDGTPIITVEHLSERRILYNNLPMVSDYDKKRLASYTLKTDDIAFSRVGSVDRNTLITECENGWLFSGRLLRIRIDKEYVNPHFLSYYFQQEPVKRRIRSVAVGQTMASLNTQILKDLKVVLPNTKTEQSAIAAVLSDTDTLIESLQKLIAKKRAIKQGAMQELLTGKRRLPGFKGKWEITSLGGLTEINKGQQLNKSELSATGEYPDWNGGIEPSGYTNKWNMAENTITISEGGNSCGFVNYCKTNFWLGGHCYALNIMSPELDKDYLYQLLKFKEKMIMSLRIGSGLPNIQKKNLKEVELYIPKEKIEQTAIASILLDLESEINGLENKIAKYNQIKHGMMQVLLTGKIRLHLN